jgi:hypothetical protein
VRLWYTKSAVIALDALHEPGVPPSRLQGVDEALDAIEQQLPSYELDSTAIYQQPIEGWPGMAIFWRLGPADGEATILSIEPPVVF